MRPQVSLPSIIFPLFFSDQRSLFLVHRQCFCYFVLSYFVRQGLPHIAHTGLKLDCELLNLLPLPRNCWSCRHLPPPISSLHSVGDQVQGFIMLGKYSTNWPTSSALSWQFIFTFICLFIGGEYATVAYRGQRTIWSNQFSLSIIWVPKMELRSPGLMANTFSLETISLILFILFDHKVMSYFTVYQKLSHAYDIYNHPVSQWFCGELNFYLMSLGVEGILLSQEACFDRVWCLLAFAPYSLYCRLHILYWRRFQKLTFLTLFPEILVWPFLPAIHRNSVGRVILTNHSNTLAFPFAFMWGTLMITSPEHHIWDNPGL